MDLRQLRHFMVLAQTGSFTQAADQLAITQSALSRSIQALEQALGATLVDRSDKRNRLTPGGQLVIERAGRVMLEVDALEADLRRTMALESGSLRVGMAPFANALLCQALLSLMAQRYPGIKLAITVAVDDALALALQDRKLDAVVLGPRLLSSLAGLNVAHLTDFSMAFICRAGHPLAHGRPVPFKALLKYPIVSVAHTHLLARGHFVRQYGEQASPEKIFSVRCEDWASMIAATRATDAIHYGSMRAVHELVPDGALVELPIMPRPEGTIQLGLVTLSQRAQAPAMAVLDTFVADQFKRLGLPVKRQRRRPA